MTVDRAKPKLRDASYPFILNTGRLRDQWHTMTRTGFVPSLMESAPDPSFSIAEHDAQTYGLEPGDLVRVTTRHGSAVLPALISNMQRPGEIFAAMHWTQTHNATGNVNQLIGAARDAHSGQPASKFENAAIEKLPAAWHGILQTRNLTHPSGQFCAARVPLSGGMHRFTMAGWKKLVFDNALPDWAARLCGADADAERIELTDAGRGTYRLGILQGNRLLACLFLAPRKDLLPGNNALATLFQVASWQTSRIGILMAIAAPQTEAGPMVCVCHRVTEAAIRTAIRESRLEDVAAIGKTLKAGTNCGSCKGELAVILQSEISTQELVV